MLFLLATSNPHKVGEIRAVFAELSAAQGVPAPTVKTLREVGVSVPEPVEDQPTFEGNALLKARYYAQAAMLPCLADDSGLEVDALHGEPGVRSARYAGVTGPRDIVDPANNRLLLDKLRGVPAEHRAARFVCAMALVSPRKDDDEPLPRRLAHLHEHPIVVRGCVEGRIIPEGAEPRGQNGFGYDPLFVIPALGKTTAELDSGEKNALSHRGNATRLLWGKLRALVG